MILIFFITIVIVGLKWGPRTSVRICTFIIEVSCIFMIFPNITRSPSDEVAMAISLRDGIGAIILVRRNRYPQCTILGS